MQYHDVRELHLNSKGVLKARLQTKYEARSKIQMACSFSSYSALLSKAAARTKQRARVAFPVTVHETSPEIYTFPTHTALWMEERKRGTVRRMNEIYK